MSKTINQLLFGGAGAGNLLGEVGLLVLRVWTGLALAFGHGLGKISAPSEFISGVEAAGFPVPLVSGWFALLGEFIGGILLASGLLTRPAALWIICVMGGAAFVVHGGDPLFTTGGPAKEMALLYFVPALCFLLTGSGRTGIDRALRK